MYELFAQTSVDALSGSGWVGAGLLGAVLSWLMFIHLPAKDKQLKEIIDGKDDLLKGIMKASGDHVRELQVTFTNALVDLHCQFDKRNEKMEIAIEKQTIELVRSMSAACVYANGKGPIHEPGVRK
jgi:hypothetical protein